MSAAASKSVALPVDRFRALFDARFSGDDALTTLRRTALICCFTSIIGRS